MNIEIVKQSENKMLGRKEVFGYVYSDGPTPKREEVRQALVEKLGVAPELLVLVKIGQEAGMKRAKVYARIYKDKGQLMKIEPKYLLLRNGLIKKEGEEKKEG